MRIFTALAIASILVGLIIGGLWWHSYYKSDQFHLGNAKSDQTQFITNRGTVTVKTQQNSGETIMSQYRFYKMDRLAYGCLILPGLWIALQIRRKLPRPGQRRRAV